MNLTWYLVLVFLNANGGMTSQQLEVDSEAACIVKMQALDNSQLQFNVPGKQLEAPLIRAICIGKK